MHEKLSQFHVTILIFSIQTGVVLFSIARILAEYFGSNGWVALLPISLYSAMNIGLIAIVYYLAKGESVFTILEQSLPKYILYPLYMITLSIFTMVGCLVIKQYCFIFHMSAFPNTNPMILKLMLDLLIFYFIVQGIYNISKAITIFFWFNIWMVLFLFNFFEDFRWIRLTPFLFKDGSFSMEGFLGVYGAYAGIIACLFLFPHVNKRTKFIKSIFIGHIGSTILYLFVCIISFGFFNYAQLKSLEFPLMNVLAFIQFPFVQSSQNLFFSFFLSSAVVSGGMYFWSAKEICKRIFPLNEQWISFIIIVISYLLAFYLDSYNKLQEWISYSVILEFSISLFLPLLLIIILIVRKKRGVSHG